MKTTIVKPSAPRWLLIDAEGQNLGRLAAEVAALLSGKHRPAFSPHQVHGDQVIVVNAAQLKFHPVKFRRKVYRKHTGYIGHLKTKSLGAMMEERPEEVIERAVKGMMPHNRLRKEMLKRLHVSAGLEHDHAAQQPENYRLASAH